MNEGLSKGGTGLEEHLAEGAFSHQVLEMATGLSQVEAVFNEISRITFVDILYDKR